MSTRRHLMLRRRHRLIVRWLAAVSVATILAGCSMTAAPRRVSVIGDSITALAQPDLSTALEPTYAIGYVFRISVRIEQMLGPVASDLRDNGPTAAVVINLGTNDAIAAGTVGPRWRVSISS